MQGLKSCESANATGLANCCTIIPNNVSFGAGADLLPLIGKDRREPIALAVTNWCFMQSATSLSCVLTKCLILKQLKTHTHTHTQKQQKIKQKKPKSHASIQKSETFIKCLKILILMPTWF